MSPALADARYGWNNQGPKTTVLQIDGHDVVYAINARGERVADEHDLVALVHVAAGLVVDLGHQRAGGVDDGQVTSSFCLPADLG